MKHADNPDEHHSQEVDIKVSPPKMENQKKEEPNDQGMIPLSKFFTFITFREKMLMILGTVSAILAGFIIPCMAIAMGQVTNAFNPNSTAESRMDQMRLICLYMCLVGIGGWIFGYIYYAFWQHLA